MSRDRGIRLQNALARYLTTWWPSAESAGSGRPGTDILGTPGIMWECKTAREFRPAEWVRQAREHAKPEPWAKPLPVVVYWPDRVGEGSPQCAMAIVPLPKLIEILAIAEYTSAVPS
ncbi:MAG TPA: hypothetical protein VKH61_06765 [Streptosporangiaceae bacterium]|nr:hypothetical protein [Streptosporangiaceae bacterium]